MSAEASHRLWQCGTCGDIYDEAEGLPDFGIPPGTLFRDLPEDWVCPLCGATKSSFSLLPD